MSLYPSLEDMKVDQMAKAQMSVQPGQHPVQPALAGGPPLSVSSTVSHGSSLYPSLNEYMGQQFTEDMVRQHVPNYQVVPRSSGQIAPVQPSGMVAPVTGANNLDLRRAEVKHGVREVILCKDGKGKVGLRVRHVNKGVFVSFVFNNSPAALAGLRFGDQILQINGENLAGFEMDKVMKIIKNAPPQRIVFAVRDRPFERTITLQKDSNGNVGFVFNDGKITAIAKDTSAARNGLLTEHNMVEVNGQNVVGLKDKEIKAIIAGADKSVTFTIVPTFIFKHIVKNMATGLVKSNMDHSVPDL